MFRFKEKQKKIFLLFITFVLTAIITSYRAYITVRCMDLNYSVDYNLTYNTLQRVKSKKLIFLNNDTAVFETCGLRIEKPYKTVNVTILLRRNKLGIWNMESSSIE